MLWVADVTDIIRCAAVIQRNVTSLNKSSFPIILHQTVCNNEDHIIITVTSDLLETVRIAYHYQALILYQTYLMLPPTYIWICFLIDSTPISGFHVISGVPRTANIVYLDMFPYWYIKPNKYWNITIIKDICNREQSEFIMPIIKKIISEYNDDSYNWWCENRFVEGNIIGSRLCNKLQKLNFYSKRHMSHKTFYPSFKNNGARKLFFYYDKSSNLYMTKSSTLGA